MNAIEDTRRGKGMGLTLVISTVLFSISRSSAVRSVNPGRTCFACSFSSTDTAGRARQCQLRNGKRRISASLRTLLFHPGHYLFDVVHDVNPRCGIRSQALENRAELECRLYDSPFWR